MLREVVFRLVCGDFRNIGTSNSNDELDMDSVIYQWLDLLAFGTDFAEQLSRLMAVYIVS